MQNEMKYVVLGTVMLLISGCTTQGGRQLMGNAADTQVAYSPAACFTLQQQCVQGEYQEWETSDKKMGCSCKKL
jgi:heme/copper-type cytochrome/quinol oxidase subunit 3